MGSCLTFEVGEVRGLSSLSALKLTEQKFDSELDLDQKIQSWDDLSLGVVLVLKSLDLRSQLILNRLSQVLSWDGSSSVGQEIAALAKDVHLLAETILQRLGSRVELVGSIIWRVDQIL